MKSALKQSITFITAVVAAAAFGFWLRGCELVTYPVTFTSLSPDDKYRVSLVELPKWIDRNFELWLEGVDTDYKVKVFRSPDEGLMIGSERIVWSVDGSHFLLLGRKFAATDAAKLPSGEQAYLLMDVRSGSIRCNARQGRFEGFTTADLRAIKWLGWSPDL